MDILIGNERRPRSPEAVESACYELLEKLNIEYLAADHPEAASMDELIPVAKALDCPIHKNLFLTNRQQSQFYLLIMPADNPFKTKYLSKQAGTARLSFADSDKLYECLKVRSGSASVLALMNDGENKVSLFVDRDVLKSEYFGCHPCKNTSSLKIKTEDIFNVLLPHLGREPLLVDLPWEVE
ncbi:MAG: prolyl-tRNA synthetase associated domain-containing protein [Oscillospiraceae bacterium]|nr:prolyl-tRNA synthetase associated domain-containing protein [Oscillospiraceae bacterium]